MDPAGSIMGNLALLFAAVLSSHRYDTGKVSDPIVDVNRRRHQPRTVDGRDAVEHDYGHS